MFLFGPIRWALKLLYFAVLAAVVYVVVSGFQVVSASHLSTEVSAVGPARAVVVLGAPVTGSEPGPDLTARLQQALLLYQAKRAPTLVIAGAPATAAAASVPASAAVTSVAESWLTANGVPASSIVTVSATDAASGLSQAVSVLGKGAQVIVVTDAIDALWTKGAASHLGLSAQVSPAVGSEKAFYSELGPLWRQATGVAVGRLIGYTRATWASS